MEQRVATTVEDLVHRHLSVVVQQFLQSFFVIRFDELESLGCDLFQRLLVLPRLLHLLQGNSLLTVAVFIEGGYYMIEYEKYSFVFFCLV